MSPSPPAPPPTPIQLLGRYMGTAVAAFLVVSVWGPTAPWLADGFIGVEYVDGFGTQWFYWFVERGVRALEPMGHTDLFFYPWGKDIFAHTGTNILDAVLAAPFRMLWGDVLGYNAFVMVGLALTAVATWALAMESGADRPAASGLAVLSLVSPYVLFELAQGRPTQAILLFPTLFVWAMLRCGHRPGWTAPVIGGLSLALSGYQYWYYALFGGLVALAWGLVCAWQARRTNGHRVLARFALMAFTALLITGPAAVQLLDQASSGTTPGLLDMDRWGLSSNPPVTVEEMTIGLLSWQPLRRFAGFYVVDPDGTERFLEQAVLIPLPVLAAVCAALRWPGRLPRWALAAALTTAGLLAMGPLLLMGPTIWPNLPYHALSRTLGVVQRLWWPARAVAFVHLLSVVAMASLLPRMRRQWSLAGAGAWLVLGTSFFADLDKSRLLPMQVWEPQVPAGYECLATGPEGAIIELPYAWTQSHLFYQSAHGRPILGGMLEDNKVFTPEAFTDFKEDNTAVAALLDLARMQAPEAPATAEDMQAIRELGYSYVVLQLDAFFADYQESGLIDNGMRARQRRVYRELDKLLGKPVYKDARIAIYSPWGEPSPCADQPVEPDAKAVGIRQSEVGNVLLRPPDALLLNRLYAGELDPLGEPWPDEDEDADDEPDGPDRFAADTGPQP